MVMIVRTMFSAYSSRGGACSLHGIEMVHQRPTAAGGCGELRLGSPRRLPRTTQWITYNPVQPRADEEMTHRKVRRQQAHLNCKRRNRELRGGESADDCQQRPAGHVIHRRGG